jgi:hypothetical protein
MNSSSAFMSQGDKKSFIFFLFLISVTAILLLLGTSTPMITGLLTILWGGFGLFRLVYLTHYQMDEVPKAFILPVQIMFGTGTKEQERRKIIVRRLTRPDFILWLLVSFLFICWAMFNGLFPSPLYLNYLFLTLQNSTPLPSPEGISPYAILSNLSFFGALVTIIFMAVTFSYNRDYLKIAGYFFAPFLVIGSFFILWQGQYAHPIIWPDLSYFKGSGFRDSQTDFIITAFDLSKSHTMFFDRFLEIGSVGAYGLYFTALPVLIMFGRTLITPNRHILKPILGISGLLLLVFIDLFIVVSPWTVFVSILLMALTAMLWGHMIRYKS